MTSCDVPSLKHLAILIAIMAIESWMGKTDKIKSGSLLELGARLVLDLLKSIFKRTLTKGDN
jgi:hypothetical protein